MTSIVLQKVTSHKSYRDALTKGLGCDLCVSLVKEIDDIIASQPTLDAAIEAVGGLCDALPELIVNPCHSFIETYLPQVIIYLVEHQLAPQVRFFSYIFLRICSSKLSERRQAGFSHYFLKYIR
jgi:hypothetical protein